MTSHPRIRARNAGLDKVRRVTARVAGGGLVLSGAIAALTSATYGGSSHHRAVTYRPTSSPGTPTTTSAANVAPLTDPTLPPTTIAVPSTGHASTHTTPTTSAPAPTTPPTVAPLQSPQTTPQTQPPYTPPVVVSGGS